MDLFLVIIGIVFICAGIKGWKFPTIKWFLRESEYGELLNRTIMIIWGIATIIYAIQRIFENANI